jgi:cation-transporting ATPase E
MVHRTYSRAAPAERRRRGEANSPVSGTTRSYRTILRTNVLSFFNIILFAIAMPVG